MRIDLITQIFELSFKVLLLQSLPLFAVFLPIYILWELSALLVRK